MAGSVAVPVLRRFASEACLERDWELAAEEADESLKPDVEGEVGLVGKDESCAASAAFFFWAIAMAFCKAALFIDGLGVSSSARAGGCWSASLRLLMVGGSDVDESKGTSRTLHEKTSEPSSKMDVSGKDEKAMLSRSSRLMPRGG